MNDEAAAIRARMKRRVLYPFDREALDYATWRGRQGTCSRSGCRNTPTSMYLDDKRRLYIVCADHEIGLDMRRSDDMRAFVCMECNTHITDSFDQFDERIEYMRIDQNERLHTTTMRKVCRSCAKALTIKHRGHQPDNTPSML